jgi:hypothetical protein
VSETETVEKIRRTRMESASIAMLADALAKAQGEFPSIAKDRTAQVRSEKGNYSYNYADLATVIAAVRPVLAKNKLSFVQRTVWSETGLHMTLETRLMHASGEWMRCTYPLATAAKPQEMGSALTYARRYSLTGLLGIATEEDDDADVAQHGHAAAETAVRPGRRVDSKDRPVGSKVGIPDCPTCKTNAEAIVSRKGPGFYCFKCSKAWDPVKAQAQTDPEVAEAAELFR